MKHTQKVQGKSSPVRAIITLADGTVWEGVSIGASRNTSGEVVFSTGMTGYTETLTDPSFVGQILVMTYPMIGNYGVPAPTLDQHGLMEHFESDRIHTNAVIMNHYEDNYSHSEAVTSFSNWLKAEGIPGVSGIDTRALTKHLRECGTMSATITIANSTEAHSEAALPKVAGVPATLTHPVSLVSPTVVTTYSPTQSKKPAHRVVLLDCGAKYNIIRELLKRNVEVVRVPYNYDFTTKKAQGEIGVYDGIMLSNGPGDPSVLTETIAIVKKSLTLPIPVFGICLGNQLLALAAGAKTYKLPYGHRGHNQPCIDVTTARCYITSQNHGYAVDETTLPRTWSKWFMNANDGTNEGIRHISKPHFSVQFHPEACAGPTDTNYLFDVFTDAMKTAKKPH